MDGSFVEINSADQTSAIREFTPHQMHSQQLEVDPNPETDFGRISFSDLLAGNTGTQNDNVDSLYQHGHYSNFLDDPGDVYYDHLQVGREEVITDIQASNLTEQNTQSSFVGSNSTEQITPCSFVGSDSTTQTTPSSFAGSDSTVKITPSSFGRTDSTVQITPSSFAGSDSTAQITPSSFGRSDSTNKETDVREHDPEACDTRVEHGAVQDVQATQMTATTSDVNEHEQCFNSNSAPSAVSNANQNGTEYEDVHVINTCVGLVVDPPKLDLRNSAVPLPSPFVTMPPASTENRLRAAARRILKFGIRNFSLQKSIVDINFDDFSYFTRRTYNTSNATRRRGNSGQQNNLRRPATLPSRAQPSTVSHALDSDRMLGRSTSGVNLPLTDGRCSASIHLKSSTISSYDASRQPRGIIGSGYAQLTTATVTSVSSNGPISTPSSNPTLQNLLSGNGQETCVRRDTDYINSHPVEISRKRNRDAESNDSDAKRRRECRGLNVSRVLKSKECTRVPTLPGYEPVINVKDFCEPINPNLQAPSVRVPNGPCLFVDPQPVPKQTLLHTDVFYGIRSPVVNVNPTDPCVGPQRKLSAPTRRANQFDEMLIPHPANGRTVAHRPARVTPYTRPAPRDLRPPTINPAVLEMLAHRQHSK